MDVVALIAWIVTALGGATIVAIWLTRGGAREPQDQAERRHMREAGRTPPELGLSMHLVIPHAVLAAVGLAFWFAFTVDTESYGQARVIAPVALALVGAIGLWMLRRWRRASTASDAPAAERDVPSTLVAVHGLAALVTFVLVVVAAVVV